MTAFEDAIASDGHALYNGEFASSVVISDGAGNSMEVNGLWQDVSTVTDPDTQAPVIRDKPAFSFWLADAVFQVKQNYTLAKGGKTFSVFSPMTNGDGSMTLLLK